MAFWPMASLPCRVRDGEATAQPTALCRVATAALFPTPPHATRRRAARARPSGRGQCRGLYTEAEGAVPRRPHGPLPDGWHLVLPQRPARPGTGTGLRAPEVAHGLDARLRPQRLERHR